MTLRADNITVMVGGKPLIQNVTLSVHPGEFAVIIGPNGAGKSTLLRALCGDVNPTSGTVQMAGRPLKEWKLRDQAKMRAVLAQSSNLTFPFSVMDVVLMGRGPHIRGGESADDYAIAYATLDAVHIEHLQDRLYTTLSGGEKQRVQLARILAQIWEPVDNNPRYLLLDEPTNNLDLNHQHSILEIARQFADDGVAVLAVLHDLNLASQYADQILVLKQGQALITGSPEAVLTPARIQEAFGIPVTIMKHPHMERPLIVPIPTVTVGDMNGETESYFSVDVEEMKPQ